MFGDKHQPTGPVQVVDPSTQATLAQILTELQAQRNILTGTKPELIVVNTAGYAFSAQGFRNSVLYAQAAGSLTVTVAGFSYTQTVQVGPNQVDFPDLSVITSSTPLTGYLIRENHSRMNGNDQTVQSLLAGSRTIYQLPITAGTTEGSYTLPFTANELLFINDGAADINFAVNGNLANFQPNLGTLYDDLDAHWTYAGTWITEGTYFKYGSGAHEAQATNSTAVLVPGTASQSISLAFVSGSATGIAQIDVSQDGGNTWVQPSTISGITRSDGVSGSALNTFDTYSNNNAIYENITYNFPNSANWAIRITDTGTRNPSGTSNNIWLDAGFVSSTQVPVGGQYVTVKTGESIPVQVQTSIVNAYCANGPQACRVIARS